MIVQIPIWRKTRLLIMKDYRPVSAHVFRSGVQVWKGDRLLFSLANDDSYEVARNRNIFLLPTQHGDQ